MHKECHYLGKGKEVIVYKLEGETLYTYFSKDLNENKTLEHIAFLSKAEALSKFNNFIKEISI